MRGCLRLILAETEIFVKTRRIGTKTKRPRAALLERVLFQHLRLLQKTGESLSFSLLSLFFIPFSSFLDKKRRKKRGEKRKKKEKTKDVGGIPRVRGALNDFLSFTKQGRTQILSQFDWGDDLLGSNRGEQRFSAD